MIAMPRRISFNALLAALAAALCAMSSVPARAQGAETLSDEQIQGRRLVFQHCGICHARRGPLAAPALHNETLAGNEETIRQFIAEGTPRMPGFKHMFTPAQIDSIVAFLKTVPKPPESTGAAESPVPAD
jgi:mono/diheme cytochrome c family protein